MKNAIEYYFVDGFGWNGHFNYSLFQCMKMECFSVHLCFLWFLSFFFFMFFKKIFLLYNVVLVLPYINMHPPRVYTCSPSGTPLPPPSPYHPSGSSQGTIPKLPVSCIEPVLVIHFLYDITHVLMPFSQIILPSLVSLPVLSSFLTTRFFMSLVKFVARCLILFDAIINRIFLFFVFDCC